MTLIIKKIVISIMFFSTLLLGSVDISGRAEYFYMARLKNAEIANIPFRLLDLNVQHQVNDKFSIFGNVGIEYRNREDTDFMTSSDIEDFSFDLRKLYMSMYVGNGEIRIGKQIHSWGSIDENSPLDNLNAYDYYYLLLGGSEKKLGSYSLAFDNQFNIGDEFFSFSFVFSPLHNTSRIPVNDPDYPIGLPAGSSPSALTTVLNDNTKEEYGINFKWLNDSSEISLSYLGLYDRIFNLSGLTVYTDQFNLGNVVEPLPRYSYRYTNALGLGTIFLGDDFTLSFDYAYFSSNDQNSLNVFNNLSENPNYTGSTVDELFGAPFLDQNLTRAFEEKVKYSQFAIQFELPLEDDIRLNAQYFKHKIEEYSSNQLGLNCDELVAALPQFSSQDCQEVEDDLGMSLENFEPQNLFIPGVGTPYALITSEAILFNIEQQFEDYDLIIDLNAFIDMDRGKGKLLSVEFEHDLGDGFEFSYGITKIFGDDSIDNYNFNRMESFSSFRSSITYYF